MLLSTSVAALFAGGGVPAAYASCVTVANTAVPFVSNSSAIDCIDVENSHVIGNVINTNSGTITPPGAAPPSHTGITVNASTIGGTISNAGKITLSGTSGVGIFVNNATVLGGISNSGTISAGINGAVIAVSVGGTVATFGGGIVNAGSISGGSSGGIDVNVTGRLSTFSGGITNANTGTFTNTSGISLRVTNGTLDTFVGGISNSGIMALGPGSGVLVDVQAVTGHAAALSSFGGGITNSGTIKPDLGGVSVVGDAIGSGATAVISNFSGGISNAGTITGTGIGSSGISVDVFARSGGSMTLSTFSGGIANSGTLVGNASLNFGHGIFLTGSALTGGTVTIGTFLGGISNSGTISYRLGGIGVAGFASQTGLVTIGSFAGGISNSGSISVSGTLDRLPGIVVGGTALSHGAVTISNFSGGIGNSGTIAADRGGILVGGSPAGGLFTRGGSVVISTFAGGITNSSSGLIAARRGNGIQVGGFAAGSGGMVTISTFDGGITNAGTVRARSNGVMVGGTAFSGASLTISSFAGGISNSGRITSLTANGIIVGGKATSGGHVSILSFAGGVTNSGRITAATSGILVGGAVLGSSVAVTISTFDGGISNSGRILARGPGILVGGTALGTNASVIISTFSGGITNSGRITSASADGIFVGGHALGLGSGTAAVVSTFSGDILNTGVINAAVSGIDVGGLAIGTAVAGVSSFAGNISNAGTINAGLAGIAVSGVSAFSGDIINSVRINAFFTGIAVSNVSTFSGNVSNGGTINAFFTGIAVSNVPTFIGDISNSGLIRAGSVGIFVCNCATFVGGSIINTGIITAATGILVHNFAPVSVFDSGTIIGTGGTAVDFTNASGGNTFTLGPGYSITGNVLAFAGGNDTFQLGGVGSGSFDLSSVGSSAQYQNFANFNVVSGIWTVFNTFGQSQAWNVDGGLLAGTGTLSALNINNGGILAPGNIGVPGTFMTVTGDLTFQPGAIYLVQLDPTAASRVNVGGAVTLAGAVDGFLSPGSYSGKTTYDILDPTSITGTFTGFTALNAPGFSGTLTYLPNEVLLNLTAQLGLGGGLNVNQQSVANGINNFFNNGGTLPANFFPFFTVTGNNLAGVLTQLDGEDATDAHFGAFQLMNQFLNLMLDPWMDGRHGGGGAIGFAPDREASFPPDVALAYAGVLKAPPKATFDDRWTVWGSAFGGTGKIAGDPVIGSTNVTASDYGFAAGMDYRASPDTVLGFALAGGGTGWNVAQGLGTGRSDAFMAGAYGTTYWGPAYLAGAVAFANHWLTTSRVALSDQLTANFTGQDVAARVEAGYRYAVPIAGAEIGIAPYGALQTQWFHTPTYSETDLTGGGFALTYNAATVNDTRSELGARFDDLVTFADKPLLLHGRLAWAHDWISGAAQTAAFQALPGSSFSVNGADGPADSALTTAMVEWRFLPRWSLTAKFDGEFAQGAQTYAGTGMLRYWW